MRLIDADALYEFIQKEKAWKQDTMRRPRYDKGKYDAYYEMLEIIEKQPTVYAAPAVTCGECKFRDTVQCPVANHLRSTDGHTDGYFSPVIIRYCGAGERKDGEK